VKAPQLLPLTVYLAAALGVVAVVGLARVGWELVRRQKP
jgi:hypothetical protein